LLAPLLPVTADELWRHLPGAREESVHLALFPAGLDRMVDFELVGRWHHLIRVREITNAAIEQRRQQKVVGTSLEAHVTLQASGDDLALLARYRDTLPMLFIVSDVTLVEGPPGSPLHVEVARAEGTKCIRCWRYVPHVSSDEALAGLCERCVDAVGTPAEHARP
jgi:isoleucyl-tRNA synthetase